MNGSIAIRKGCFQIMLEPGVSDLTGSFRLYKRAVLAKLISESSCQRPGTIARWALENSRNAPMAATVSTMKRAELVKAISAPPILPKGNMSTISN